MEDIVILPSMVKLSISLINSVVRSIHQFCSKINLSNRSFQLYQLYCYKNSNEISATLIFDAILFPPILISTLIFDAIPLSLLLHSYLMLSPFPYFYSHIWCYPPFLISTLIFDAATFFILLLSYLMLSPFPYFYSHIWFYLPFLISTLIFHEFLS